MTLLPSSSSSSSSIAFFPIAGTRTTTRRMGISLLAGIIWLFSFVLKAQTTNDPVQAVIQGRELAGRILEQRPEESFTNSGTLRIRDGSGKTSEIPIRCEVLVTSTNWRSIYDIRRTSTPEDRPAWAALSVEHSDHAPNRYTLYKVFPEVEKSGPIYTNLSGGQAMIPFAGSDFWLCDLGLEFFHWPRQKILKPYEMRRGRSCKVLESTDPHPAPDGYSRVVSWIDNETLGIVQAEAYGTKGKLLKEFYPKDFRKVNGQWEVGEMEMINVQTDSRSWIKFNLNQRR